MNKNVLAFILAVAIFPVILGAVPISVFVVHCEPTNANPAMFIKLEEMVLQADMENVPVTILMTPQWAQMITDDPVMLTKVTGWIDDGHEIGCHHHGYWGTKDRPATWDGYTNTPYEELDAADQPDYAGDMTDYWAFFDGLPGTIQTGCFGDDEDDKKDWFEELIYATKGHEIADAVTIPELVDCDGIQPWQIGHCFLYGSDSALLRPLYLATSDDSLFGVNVHVYNYDEADAPTRQWLDFLRSHEDRGDYRMTVSDAITGYLAIDEELAQDELELKSSLSSIITYTLHTGGQVRLTVYDVSGREVAILVNETQAPGEYSVNIDELESGVYFCRLAVRNQPRTARIVLVE